MFKRVSLAYKIDAVPAAADVDDKVFEYRSIIELCVSKVYLGEAVVLSLPNSPFIKDWYLEGGASSGFTILEDEALGTPEYTVTDVKLQKHNGKYIINYTV